MSTDRATRKRIRSLEKEIGRLAHVGAQYEDILRFRVLPPDVDVRTALAKIEATMAEYQAELARLEAADG